MIGDGFGTNFQININSKIRVQKVADPASDICLDEGRGGRRQESERGKEGVHEG